jgi:hypothetical protein
VFLGGWLTGWLAGWLAGWRWVTGWLWVAGKWVHAGGGGWAPPFLPRRQFWLCPELRQAPCLCCPASLSGLLLQEFVAATVNLSLLEREEIFIKAFQQMDKVPARLPCSPCLQ